MNMNVNIPNESLWLQKNLKVEQQQRMWELTSQIAMNILENWWDSNEMTDAIILELEKIKTDSYNSIVGIEDSHRNFDIKVSENWKNISIVLIHKETKQEFDLSTLFPNSWYKFVVSDVDCYFNGSFTVWVNLNNINLRWFILWILHEIWHSHQVLESKPKMFLKMALVAFSYSKLWVFFQKQLEKLKVTTEEDVLDEAYIQSKKERNAWAYALVQARKLEKMWWNVFGSFSSKQEVFNQIWWHLESYDECLFYDMLDTFWEITPENTHELSNALTQRPLFNKKTKNLYQISIPWWNN